MDGLKQKETRILTLIREWRLVFSMDHDLKNEEYSKWSSKSGTVLVLFSMPYKIEHIKHKAMGITNMEKWHRSWKERKMWHIV